MPEADALALVAEAERRLWTDEGRVARRYLNHRGLDDETIRTARLGWAPRVRTRTADNRSYTARGIVIPWLDGGRPTLIKIRQGTRIKPKYVELFRARPTLYPGHQAVQAGRPLIVAEGEFDCLLLNQELAGLASVVTLGSASARPGPDSLGSMLAAPVWYIATDADPAGERAADGWPPVARRVRPPGAFKDWTEASQGGIDLRRWWRETMTRETLLARLQARGIRLDGRLVHPRIAVGTVTGRVVYTGTDPALQALPGTDRLARLAPAVEGRRFVRADYGQIEPRIMLAVLRRRGSIAWDAGDDLYGDLADGSTDRATVKVTVNRLINGGRLDSEAAGRLAEFAVAVEDYRAELAADARSRGHVATLAGRAILLSVDEPNFAGKAVNRVVQGTAADIFHRAVLGIGQALGRSGDVAFLLHDELWVECDPADAATVAALVNSEMRCAALELGIHVPVRVEPDPGPPRYTWEQLRRWRWGPAVGDPTPGIIIDRPPTRPGDPRP